MVVFVPLPPPNVTSQATPMAVAPTSCRHFTSHHGSHCCLLQTIYLPPWWLLLSALSFLNILHVSATVTTGGMNSPVVCVHYNLWIKWDISVFVIIKKCVMMTYVSSMAWDNKYKKTSVAWNKYINNNSGSITFIVRLMHSIIQNLRS
jgi:hypothetical protein